MTIQSLEALAEEMLTWADSNTMPEILASEWSQRITAALADLTVDEAMVYDTIQKVRSMYPTDIFPENGESLDCKSARMARLTCDNIAREFAALTAALNPRMKE